MMHRTEEKHYPPSEEIANILSHGAGILFSVLGTALLCAHSGASFRAWAGALIYGISLGVMFTASALYHGSKNPARRGKFRKFDHSAIYLLIAGTYTPLMLLAVRGSSGMTVLTAVWMIALTGIPLEFAGIKPFRGFSILLYLSAGWLCIAILPALIRGLPDGGFYPLLAGGIAYTAGVPFYLSKRAFAHACWHIFVLAGAVLHFLAVLTLYPR